MQEWEEVNEKKKTIIPIKKNTLPSLSTGNIFMSDMPGLLALLLDRCFQILDHLPKKTENKNSQRYYKKKQDSFIWSKETIDSKERYTTKTDSGPQD